jgi:Uma2 family endonuclease
MRIALPAPDETVVLEGVSREEFEEILSDLGDSRARRVAYDNGRLEIMSPSQIHERIARILTTLLDVLAAEFGLEVLGTGAWTLKRLGLDRAVEGDRTFYLGDEKRILSLARSDLDLTRDPPPDLAMEVEVTRKSIPRFPIYADLGVPEIWRWAKGRLEVWQRQGKGYERADTSRFFPGFPVPELAGFVEGGLGGAAGDVRLAREFREWVRGKLGR